MGSHRGRRSKPPQAGSILVAVGTGLLLAGLVLGVMVALGY